MLRDSRYAAFASQILRNDWVKPNKRIFNNAKVSDHFAIIPTTVVPKHLSEPEQKLYDLVTKRFLAVFYPPAEFLITTRITRVEGEPFKSEGKVMVKAGWMEVYGKEVPLDDAPILVAVERRRAGQGRPGPGAGRSHQAAGPVLRSHAALGRWKARAS